MATLRENVDKIVNALAEDKTALTEKEVEVPEGTKHSDVPDLIRSIQSGENIPIKVSNVRITGNSSQLSLWKESEFIYDLNGTGSCTLIFDLETEEELDEDLYIYNYEIRSDYCEVSCDYNYLRKERRYSVKIKGQGGPTGYQVFCCYYKNQQNLLMLLRGERGE